MVKRAYHGIEEEVWVLMGDPHARPDESNARFTIGGNFINDRRPKKFVCVGDFGDFPSLSSYDKGKKSHEGMRYTQDVLSVIDAQEKLFGAIKKGVRSQMEAYLLGGNHDEGRINKALNNDAQRDDISIKDCLYDDFWTYSSFGKKIAINDIYFNHYFAYGNMGKAISNENIGKALVEKMGRSCFVGHSHLRRLYSRTNVADVKELAGDVGCFFDFQVDYMPPEPQANWSRGLLVLTVQGNDILNHEWVDMETLKRDYH
jgi:hypothetical protein